MNYDLPSFDAWLLHTAAGGSLLLLACALAMKWCRQPAWRQHLGEWGLVGALLLSVLSLVPAWLVLPILPSEAPGSVADSRDPPFPTPSSSPAFVLERNFVPRPAGTSNEPGGARENFNAPAWQNYPLAMSSSPDHRQHADFKVLDPDSSAVDIDQVAETEDTAVHRAAAERWSLAQVGSALLAGVEFVYVLAALVFLGRWLVGHWVLTRRLHSAHRAPGEVARLFRHMARGLRRRPRLLVCRNLQMPVSCGVLQPTVVIPESFCAPGAAKTLPWVFAHELTHLERNDALACSLFGLGQALYFYLPWFWWLRRQVRLCQEYVADATAAAHASDPEEYAQFLLTLVGQPALPLGTNGVSGYSSDLFRRVTMLLQGSKETEKCCPRWWSLSAAGAVIALAVLVSGVSLRAKAASISPPDDDEVVVVTTADDDTDDAPSKEETKKKAEKKQKTPVHDLQQLEQQLQQMQLELKKMHEQLHSQLPAMGDFTRVPLKGLESGMMQGFEFDGAGSHRRLGVHLQPPSAELADQLNLSKDEGLVIAGVEPKSAAAKAGLKAHDILIEFNGAAVSSDPAKLAHTIQEIKGKATVEAVVIRKGKKVTIEEISLPEAKAGLEFDAPMQFGRFGGKGLGKGNVIEFQGPGEIKLPAQRFFSFPGNQGQNGQHVSVSVSNNNGKFSATRQEGSLTISATGNVADGKIKLDSIKITDGEETNQYKGIAEVPEEYREKVKGLVETGVNGKIKVEMKEPKGEKKSSKKKDKDQDDEDPDEDD